jgi:hypothetical protein
MGITIADGTIYKKNRQKDRQKNRQKKRESPRIASRIASRIGSPMVSRGSLSGLCGGAMLDELDSDEPDNIESKAKNGLCADLRSSIDESSQQQARRR